jgi:hypothetical protein
MQILLSRLPYYFDCHIRVTKSLIVLNKIYYCHGKVKDIYESKELWRGPESIYRKEGVLAMSGDNYEVLTN